MRMLGIDPGLEGALSLIDTDTKTLYVRPMPIWRRVTSATDKSLVDAYALGDLLREWGADEACVEDVWSSSQMGPVSAFSFGDSKGVLRGALGVLGVHIHWVPPSTWKGEMKISAVKQHAKKQGHLIFPGCEKLLSTPDKAESALLALYGICTHHSALVPGLVPLSPGK